MLKGTPPMTKVQQHLSIPENRLRYAFIFLDDHGFNPDDDCAEEVRIKCYNGIAEWSDKLDNSEAHF